jgi:16S rRNA (guanine1207-N2)-methyltransferase
VTSGSHYFDAEPAASSSRRTVALTLPDLSVELLTDRGVFSMERVDAGTKFLLLDAPAPPADVAHALDLGCGYGPIAIALASRLPNATVWAVDVNERAVELCRDNATALGLSGLRVSTVSEDDPFDGVPAEVRFDLIWSNPPIRIGKEALHSLLLRWLGRLETSGEAILVVQKHLGSDSLQRWLTAQGYPTERLASRAGYRLLRVRRQVTTT